MSRTRLQRTGRAAFLVVAGALAFAPQTLHAQAVPRPMQVWVGPKWVGDAVFLSFNALVSGVGAGALQRLRGESFAGGFAGGALGGSIHYAGLRVGSRTFDGAGLIGRQISAVGISVVRNASEGRGVWEETFVPVGPLHLYVRRGDAITVRPKVNLLAVGTLISAASRSDLTWDAAASLSAGAPVFRTPPMFKNGAARLGYVRFGSIILSDPTFGESRARVFAHERVHILQRDWLFHVWGDPVESRILERLPGGRFMYRFFDVDAAAVVLRGGAYDMLRIPTQDRFHEVEARFLENR